MVRILIIEDDGAQAESTRQALEQAGLTCTCECVQSEAEFRRALARRPDVILAEWDVAGLEGWEALAIARTEHPDIPFIFVTELADATAEEKARERGAAGLVTKPNLTSLPALVRTLLAERARRALPPDHERRRSEPPAEASSTAVYLLERQAVLDRALQDEDRSALSSMMRRHPPIPVALLAIRPESVRDRFVKWLRNANIEIESVASTPDALAMLEARTHALLFTDRLELVQAARQLYAGSATHVVFVDATGEVGVRTALRMGANDCMPAEPSGEEFWAHLTTARRIASLAASLQLALTDNRILATIDELTRCGSRRFFEHEFPREVERAVRLHHPLSLLMCDIDHFKAVNDGHGHGVGDQVLQEFAGRLTQGLRAGVDWVARVGGEEFAVILPDVPAQEARTVAERLRESIRAAAFASAAGPLTLTASFGVCGLEEVAAHDRESARALAKAADAALYESKRKGRNRVTVARIRPATAPQRARTRRGGSSDSR